LKPALEGQICQKLATAEILTILNSKYKLPISEASKQRLGKALKANHFISSKSNGKQVYHVRFRDQEKEGYLSQIPDIDNKLEFS
jgi:hypothetical protein